MNTTTETIRFEVGETYYTRSACDYDCIYRFLIVRRTERSVWFREDDRYAGEIKRRAIRVFQGVETFQPFGSYSMSPIASADRKAELVK